jgi:hypothetical protein
VAALQQEARLHLTLPLQEPWSERVRGPRQERNDAHRAAAFPSVTAVPEVALARVCLASDLSTAPSGSAYTGPNAAVHAASACTPGPSELTRRLTGSSTLLAAKVAATCVSPGYQTQRGSRATEVDVTVRAQ